MKRITLSNYYKIGSNIEGALAIFEGVVKMVASGATLQDEFYAMLLRRASMEANSHEHFKPSTHLYCCSDTYLKIKTAGIGWLELKLKEREKDYTKTAEHSIPCGENLKKLVLDNVNKIPGAKHAVLEYFTYNSVSHISDRSDKSLNKLGLKEHFPSEFFDKISDMYLNPWARYMKAGIELYEVHTGNLLDMSDSKGTLRYLKPLSL
jgi:hypothetical protein